MRNSVCHSATIYANAIMHAGTTVDTFLRENLVRQTIYSSNVSMVSFGFLVKILTDPCYNTSSGLVEQSHQLG